MDSITQIALGAAVGEAVLGRRAGNAAPAWGAALGTLPDLDVLLYPFLDPVNQLAVHRAFSHSILFSVAAAPLLGLALARLHRGRPAMAKNWTLLVFLAFFTHLVIDSFTVYGTQVLWPFSTYPVSFNSMFIIDPLYTVPLAVGVLLSLWNRRDGTRRLLPNRVGLILSSLYLASTLWAKIIAERSFHASLDANGIVAERVMTTPALPGSLLWMGVAAQGDTLHVGLTGLLDGELDTRIVAVPVNGALLDGHADDPGVRRLRWFSKGWWAIEEGADGAIYVNDLRFGRTDAFLSLHGEYVFRFRLTQAPDGQSEYSSFEQVQPDLRFSAETFEPVVERIFRGSVR